MARRPPAGPQAFDLILGRHLQFAVWHAAARIAGWFRARPRGPLPPESVNNTAQPGISVIIPSREGRELLASQLPGIAADLDAPCEVIVVDNGSADGTAGWLAGAWPEVKVVVSPEPLSFAAAINRGIGQARYSHVCLLNNDMRIEPGFFAALRVAFDKVPRLFCATAQIRFPAGVRREETGKAVMAQAHPDDFPIRCDEPFRGEDLTYVLYGSGGCSLYDAGMLLALGGVDEAYAPAYVEDLDLGYRAWQRGWPTVFVAGAVAEHRHRATTSRYYTEEQLAEILEVNYLRFLTRAVAHGPLFRKLWNQAAGRLRRRGDPALRHAVRLALAATPPAPPHYREEEFLALTSGDVAVFPGAGADCPPVVAFTDSFETPADTLLAAHCEVVLVRRGRELAMQAATLLTRRKWRLDG